MRAYLKRCTLGALATLLPGTGLIAQHGTGPIDLRVGHPRVEEAIDLLQEQGNQKITDILYDVGFNNRSSFYKAFKKNTGYSPSEYLQR